jgi:hypothetical protein
VIVPVSACANSSGQDHWTRPRLAGQGNPAMALPVGEIALIRHRVARRFYGPLLLLDALGSVRREESSLR